MLKEKEKKKSQKERRMRTAFKLKRCHTTTPSRQKMVVVVVINLLMGHFDRAAPTLNKHNKVGSVGTMDKNSILITYTSRSGLDKAKLKSGYRSY